MSWVKPLASAAAAIAIVVMVAIAVVANGASAATESAMPMAAKSTAVKTKPEMTPPTPATTEGARPEKDATAKDATDKVGPAFRFHLFKEPEKLLPWAQRNSNASSVLTQVIEPVFRLDDGEFKPGLARSCKWVSEKSLRCELRSGLKWSDGSPLSPKDFVESARRFFMQHSPQAEEFFDLRGAAELYHEGQSKDFGVEADESSITYHLKQANREFLYKVTSLALAPSKEAPDQPGGFISTGPYRIVEWKKGNKFVLEPNPFYFDDQAKLRPRIKVIFVTEDSVALKIYEKGDLDFLRRLPTAFIASHRNRPDFHKIEQIRFDYMGFAKGKVEKNVREALALGIDYEGMQKLFHAKPRPGCFGLPYSWSDGPVCLDRNLAKARQRLKTAPKKLKVSFSYSVEDHRRSFEWLQVQLKKDLGFDLELDGLETKLFLQKIEDRRAPFFRRGVIPHRPTCAGVLENFLPGGPNNYLDLDSPMLKDAIEKMKMEFDEKKKRQLCRNALLWLRDELVMIPTGPIFFAVLAAPAWRGWKLSPFNVLDLRDLRRDQI